MWHCLIVVASSRNKTVQHGYLVTRRHNHAGCAIEGDRVISVSYTLYRVPGL